MAVGGTIRECIMNKQARGLHYRGFTARIYYDEEEGVVFGHVPTTDGGIDFRCNSLGGIASELRRVVDAYLAEHPDAEPVEPGH